jgi:hypothetical protein
VYQGRCFPPKYVVSLAARHATGQALPSNEFNGGTETNTFLRNLGFHIARKAEDTTLIEAQPETVAVRKQPALANESAGTHSERCQGCKAAVLALLQNLYGAVEIQKQFDIGAGPDAFRASICAPDLQKIFTARQSRNHKA